MILESRYTARHALCEPPAAPCGRVMSWAVAQSAAALIVLTATLTTTAVALATTSLTAAAMATTTAHMVEWKTAAQHECGYDHCNIFLHQDYLACRPLLFLL